MSVLKKISFSLISIFLGYRTIELMKYLVATQERALNNIDSIVISFLLTLFTTGVFAFLGFSFKTSKLLPESYYSIKNPKFLRQIYTLLGVKYFRFLLMVAFWGNKKNRAKYFDGTRAGFENLIYQTKQSEFGHLGALVVNFLLSILLIFKGYWQLFIFITLINFIGNFYPVILQRKHRLRIEKITKNNKAYKQ